MPWSTGWSTERVRPRTDRRPDRPPADPEESRALRGLARHGITKVGAPGPIRELFGPPFVDCVTSLGPPPREVHKGTASAQAASGAVLLHFSGTVWRGAGGDKGSSARRVARVSLFGRPEAAKTAWAASRRLAGRTATGPSAITSSGRNRTRSEKNPAAPLKVPARYRLQGRSAGPSCSRTRAAECQRPACSRTVRCRRRVANRRCR